jgi:predicted phage terminase large subunit-like protein
MHEQCAHWEALYRGLIEELAVNVPPGQSKTVLAAILLPAWIWTVDPAYRFMFASYSAALSRKGAKSSIALIKSPWYRERWPEVTIAGSKNTAAGEFFTTAGGSRFTTSIGGQGTGTHAHMFVVDDPVKAADAFSHNKALRARLNTATEWIASTLGSRGLGGKSAFKVGLVMQRMHASDPSAVLIERGAVHLMLPEKFEPERRCVTRLGGDHRRKEGELLNPLRFDERAHAKRVKGIGKGAGYESPAVQAQLQQRPNPKGGVIFKAPFKRFTLADMPFSDTQSVISLDAAFKDESKNDFVAIEVWGFYSGNFYLYFTEMAHLGFHETLERLLLVQSIWHAQTLIIEDAANGPAIIQTLTRKLGVVNVVAVPTGGGIPAKASAAGAYYAAGKVYHLDEAWAEEKERNLTGYPHGVQHDDDTAATSQAILHLAEQSSGLEEALEAWRSVGLTKPVQPPARPERGAQFHRDPAFKG